MKRKDVLAEAERAVNGNREEDYGSPEANFETIAKLWSIYLDKGIDPQDVAAMMILLKISRIKNGPGKDDNWVDVAGYAACGGELGQENVPKMVQFKREGPLPRPKEPISINDSLVRAFHDRGLTIPEIADELKCSEQDVRNILKKGERNG